MPKLPKAIYRFNAIPIKISMAFLYRHRKNNSNISIEPARTPNGFSTILKKNNKAGGITLPNFKTLQSYSNKNSMAVAQRQTYRPMKQNRKH